MPIGHSGKRICLFARYRRRQEKCRFEHAVGVRGLVSHGERGCAPITDHTSVLDLPVRVRSYDAHCLAVRN